MFISIMTINLTYVCENAGKRDRWYDELGNAHSYIPFTLIHARKIFCLIKQYAAEGNIINAMLYIKRHSQETGDKRVLEQWEKHNIGGDRVNNKFAERLFDLLVEHKLMPAQFASEMGISPNTVYNWLRGDYLPNLIMFFRICEDYDVDPKWLWGGVE